MKSGATVDVGGDALIDGGKKSTLGQNTSTTVFGTFTRDAAAANKCSISGSATVVAGGTAGICL